MQDVTAARDRFIDFCSYIDHSFMRTPHVELICDRLEAVERGEVKRLMILLPPRSSKSLIGSTMFPSWYLGREPSREAAVATYSTHLAARMKMDAAKVMRSHEYGRLFHGHGRRTALGVGDIDMGNAHNLIICDDLMSDWHQAQKIRERDRVWRWYQAELRPRLREDGAIVVFASRFHRDDFPGRLLAGSENWDVLTLPALAGQNDEMGRAQGEALCPRWWSAAQLVSIKRSMSASTWRASFQQNVE